MIDWLLYIIPYLLTALDVFFSDWVIPIFTLKKESFSYMRESEHLTVDWIRLYNSFIGLDYLMHSLV
jgi:hypothetical protein